MKKCVVLLGLLVCFATKKVSAQTYEVQQLLLNVEKLAQLKQILSDLKKGYEIVSTGYNAIKNISEGNFDLHQVFLDGLLQVSPIVKNYKRVKDIINGQLQLVKEYKLAYSRFRKDINFLPEELDYIEKVYANLIKQSLSDLDALAMIITANKLRMSDDERLKAIDNIFDYMQKKIQFLRHFNNETTILAIQRAKERNNIDAIRTIYGINQ